MKKRKILLTLAAIMLAGSITMGCSGGGSAGGGGSDSGSGGDADVSTLSSVPSVDISALDYSQASTGTSYVPSQLQALTVATDSIQRLGENLDAVGNASRAGCEANMHKKEMIRMSQQAQLDRCYPEAMESAGLITIPTDEFALYKIDPPDHSAEEQAQFCDDIPDEFADEKAACEGGEGPEGGTILLRLGIIGGELQIDMCEGETGSETLIDEATYSANGSVYTATVTRIGTWAGHQESMSFTMNVDLGTEGSVTDGSVNLGSDGSATATGHMSGGFGSGLMTFAADAATGSNTVSGAFAGDFTDPFTNASTSFTGRVHSQFGGSTNTGTAKFGFTGSMPPFPVSEMLPFGMPDTEVTAFLQALGADLGIQLTLESVLCPNPDFDPESFDNTVKPMIAPSDDGTCASVTNTGVESFAITNGTVNGDFGTEITQAFTIIADADSAYFDDVNPFDLTTLDPTINSVAFVRNWDCSGTFTELNFENFSADEMQAVDQAMQSCFAMEEQARGNEGMGGYNCGQQEQQNGVEDFAQNGGPSFGIYGGEYRRVSDTCNNQTPDFIFLDAIDPENNRYCFPAEGACSEVTISSNNLTGLNVSLFNGIAITDLSYTQSGENAATAVEVTYDVPCTANYNIVQPSFEAPPEFGAGGGAPGEGNDGPFMPQPCADAGLTTEDACMQLCQDPSVNCFE